MDILPPENVKRMRRKYFTFKNVDTTSMPNSGVEPETPGTSAEKHLTVSTRTANR